MIIQKKSNKNRAVKASRRTANHRARAIRANEEMEAEGVVDVDPEASSLLFEAEDVAELVAEVTGEEVSVTAEDDVVKFEVGDDEFTVEADGDEEILETSRKAFRGKTAVKASRRVSRRRR